MRALALGDPTLEQLSRVQTVFPVTAVSVELSLTSRGALTGGLLPWCRDHGVGVLARAPLGRGALVARGGTAADAPDGPAELLRRVAERHDATPAQVALAWVLRQGPGVVPLPGIRSPAQLRDSAAAVALELRAHDLALLDGASDPDAGDGAPVG